MNRYVFAVALMTASVAMSSAGASSDFNGAPEIQRGDYASAERVIQRQLQMWPGDADLLLNLAIVYRQTGRASEARAAYRIVLARPDEVMDLPASAPRSSHVLARAALTGMDGTQITAR